MNTSDRQRVTIVFTEEQRETIKKAAQKLADDSYRNWGYFHSSGSESAFIRDVATYTAEQILGEAKGRGELLRRQVGEVGLLTSRLESECGRLRKLFALRPDRAKPTRAKR